MNDCIDVSHTFLKTQFHRLSDICFWIIDSSNENGLGVQNVQIWNIHTDKVVKTLQIAPWSWWASSTMSLPRLFLLLKNMGEP